MAESNDAPFDEAILSTLPPILRAVITALGIAKATDFLTKHGGVNVIIPKKTSIVLGLDQDQIKLLRLHLRNHMDENGRIWLPKFDKVAMQYRNIEIRKKRGTSTLRKMAKEYNLSSRQIQNITQEKDENQTDIFNL